MITVAITHIIRIGILVDKSWQNEEVDGSFYIEVTSGGSHGGTHNLADIRIHIA